MATTFKKLKTQKGQQVMNFTDELARDYFERMRWPDGAACVHCGSANVYRLQGKSHRPGLFECRDCKGHFTVTVGTVMEDSHLPLSTWAKAFHLMCSSKKGMSSLQLQRNLGLGSYKTAWHLSHRIREAMRYQPVSGKLKGEVQVDETYMGGKPRPGDGKKHGRGRATSKAPVIALVETGGRVVSQPLGWVDSNSLSFLLHASVDPSAKIVTDEYPSYPKAAAGFKGGHQTVNHTAGQYVGPGGINVNSAESFFALLKRGVYGTFHHVSKRHLRRYVDEFSFRWNGRSLDDTDRRDAAVKGAEGKRLMYRAPVAKAG
jgi:transposase-like protein